MFQILVFFFCVEKLQPPLKKVTPSFPATSQQEGKGGGVHTINLYVNMFILIKYMLGNDIAWHVFYQYKD